MYTKALATWQVDGRAPTFAEAAKGELFGKACRIAAGAEERTDAVRKRAREEATAKAKGPAVDPTPAAPGTIAKKIKLSTVADQANDGEIFELTDEVVTAAYARYELLTGGQPEPR